MGHRTQMSYCHLHVPFVLHNTTPKTFFMSISRIMACQISGYNQKLYNQEIFSHTNLCSKKTTCYEEPAAFTQVDTFLFNTIPFTDLQLPTTSSNPSLCLHIRHLLSYYRRYCMPLFSKRAIVSGSNRSQNCLYRCHLLHCYVRIIV